MRLFLPVLVHHDPLDRYHVRTLEPLGHVFVSASLAEAMDDATLHLMEQIPDLAADRLGELVFAPDLSLRRLHISTRLRQGERQHLDWTGRLSVIVERWRGLDTPVVRLPTVDDRRFVVPALIGLADHVAAYLHRTRQAEDAPELDQAVCQPEEHLEILEVETELPTVLPSRGRRKRHKRQLPGAQDEPESKQHVPPVTLREVCRNLAHAAIDGTLLPAFGRDDLVATVLTELARPGAAVLLVGASGVGKSALAHEVVRQLVDPNAPVTERTDVWEVDGNRLVAGMSMVGAWQRRMELLVAELSARDDVLYVDDLPTLVFTGRSAQSDSNVAAFLEPHLAHGEIRILGETTPERLAACREEAPGFFARFRLVHVDALPPRETLMVLLRSLRQLEGRGDLVMRPEALEAVQSLARRFHAREHEPGASVRLLHDLSDLLEPTRTDPSGRGIVDREVLTKAYQRQTGLPDFVLSPRAARKPEEISAWFAHRILGQPHAVAAATDVVVTLQQGLDDPSRPVATLLLVGPTGVGKTETAKAIATWLFGGPERMVRLDMSELRDTAALTRLVGDAKHPEGELTRRVADQPFSVVLFDEIEKAHPAIFDLLLQVMGEGRLTNAAGRTTDFTNTVVLLTSNLGVAESGRAVGFGGSSPTERDQHFAKAAEAFFRPEFFNRIDRVVPYRALEREHVAQLAARLVQGLMERRGLRASSVVVDVDPALVDLLVTEGFDPTYGARALKRTVERRLTVPLARRLATQRVEHMVWLDVHPTGRRVQIESTPLAAPAPLDPARGAPNDWPGLRELHARMEAGLDELEQSTIWAEARTARTELIVVAQEDSDPALVRRLSGLTQLLDGAQRCRDILVRISEEVFASFFFEDSWEYERVQSRRYVGRYNHQYSAWKISEVDRARQLERTRADLVRAMSEDTLNRWRAQHALSSPTPALLRVLPACSGGDILVEHLQRLHGALRLALGVWGDVTASLTSIDGTWQPDDSAPRDGTPQGHALVAWVPGGDRLLETLRGMVISTCPVGPDQVTTLLRIDLLDGSTPAEKTLAEADAAWFAWRERRRRGETLGPSPHPGLPCLLQVGLADHTQLQAALETRLLQHARSLLGSAS